MCGGIEESQSLQVLALPIFPVRLQTSIFGASELNFRVRDGNGWTLTAINTNLLFLERKSKQKELYAGSVSVHQLSADDCGLHCHSFLRFPAQESLLKMSSAPSKPNKET